MPSCFLRVRDRCAPARRSSRPGRRTRSRPSGRSRRSGRRRAPRASGAPRGRSPRRARSSPGTSGSRRARSSAGARASAPRCRSCEQRRADHREAEADQRRRQLQPRPSPRASTLACSRREPAAAVLVRPGRRGEAALGACARASASCRADRTSGGGRPSCPALDRARARRAALRVRSRRASCGRRGGRSRDRLGSQRDASAPRGRHRAGPSSIARRPRAYARRATLAAVEVLLANPRGFCAGVDRAIEIVERRARALRPAGLRAPRDRPQPARGRGAAREGRGLRRRPARRARGRAADLQRARRLARGARGGARAAACARSTRTCPLVTKVHVEALRIAHEGYEIVLVGHAGHVEVEGTMGHAPDRMHLVETRRGRRERSRCAIPTRSACVTQTTLSVDDTREVHRGARARASRRSACRARTTSATRRRTARTR